jgi:hypothetical protein
LFDKLLGMLYGAFNKASVDDFVRDTNSRGTPYIGTWERKHSGLTLLFLCGSLGADCGDLAPGPIWPDLAERPMLAVLAGLDPGAAGDSRAQVSVQRIVGEMAIWTKPLTRQVL